MTALTWTEALALKQPRMDRTHQEFVELLQGLEAVLADGVERVDAQLAELLAHTELHFAQEERWMADIGFAPENCHAFQHAHVLKVLREVPALLRADASGQMGRRFVDELAQWFVTHAQLMDAALAETMLERGYDPETRTLREPLPAEAGPITGCGSSRCG